MSIPSLSGRVLASIATTLLIACGNTAFAAAPPAAASSTPTREMREKMALVHEQMAACLRSDKAIAACRAEMQKSCHDMMGDQGCRMAGMGAGMMSMGHGMHRHMRAGTPASPSPPK